MTPPITAIEAIFHRELLDALPVLRRVAWGLTRSTVDAEDLAQATIVKALEYRTSYTIGSSMTGWLCTICRHAFLGERRRAWRRLELSDDDAMLISVEPTQLRRLELIDVLNAISTLRPDRAAMLRLVAIGHSQEEIAVIQHVRLGTVKSRTKRARNLLMHKLGEGARA